MNFPFGDQPIRIGMLGMTEGNAHPFSWSAMINGSYDHELMTEYCKTLDPSIPDYSEECHYLQLNEKQILSSRHSACAIPAGKRSEKGSSTARCTSP